jgi:hypothetical protein
MHTREANLHQLACDRLERGELPRVRMGLRLDHAGSGEPCALCGAPVLFEEIEWQLPGDLGTHRFRFHAACHTVWVTASITLDGTGTFDCAGRDRKSSKKLALVAVGLARSPHRARPS